jgi:hypothetical protein
MPLIVAVAGYILKAEGDEDEYDKEIDGDYEEETGGGE